MAFRRTIYLIADFSANLQVTQLTFTCSKSTIKTLGKGVKYVQSAYVHQKDVIEQNQMITSQDFDIILGNFISLYFLSSNLLAAKPISGFLS